MTRLLVSVRDVSEAQTALAAGADLIDIKEPRHGSLGRADEVAMQAIVGAVAGRVPVSAAFGELLDWNPADTLPGDTMAGLDFAKVGLAGCAAVSDWFDRWQAFDRQLPDQVGRVAVIYADATAGAPAASEILSRAGQLNCAAVLIDTFDKRRGPLPVHWTLPQIQSLVLEIQSLGMWAVLAGGLTESAIEQLLPLAPDLFAVRSAVCVAAERSGAVSFGPIQRLSEMLRPADPGPKSMLVPPRRSPVRVFA